MARDHILKRKPALVTVLDTKSSPVDVVTAMDKEVESLLRTELARRRPNDGFLGEEGDSIAGTSGYTWIIDPIDGTVNYLYGRDDYSVSVAVVYGAPNPSEWTQLAGAVVRVPDGRTWSASRGGGAWCDGQRLESTAPLLLEQCLVGTGFSYSSKVRELQAAVLHWILPKVRDIRRSGSAALELCYLAEGGADLFYERGLNVWDMAAGTLIVRESGAVVGGLSGQSEGPEMTVAGSSGMVTLLTALLEEFRETTKL